MAGMDLVPSLVSFAVVAGLLTITPGLDTALVLRSAVAHGTRHGFATALGVNAGVLAWGAGATVGVSALLTASTVAFTALTAAGSSDPAGGPAAPESCWAAWRRGLVTNLVNPKIGAFYVAVLPQFVPEGASPLTTGLLLALVHNVEGLAWFTALILGAGRARPLLQRRSARRAVDAVTGTALIGFGLRLGLTR
jgi:threonine/homoserine/homoserine lactone efflux protein